MTMRLRVLPRFPALITGADGFTVERDGVDLIVKPDYGSVTRIPAVQDNDKVFFLTWNEETDSYSIMAFTDAFDAIVDTNDIMVASVYDPQEIGGDAFDYANMTGTIDVDDIEDESITSAKIADGTIATEDLSDGAVTSAKIADGTIATSDLASATLEDIKWLSKAVGEFYTADDGVTGVDIPPSSTTGSTVWVDLTSGLTGAGLYNENKLTSESVTGSAPLVQATAVVSLTGSPMLGQTLRLINTERRMLRAGSAGTIQADALQNVTGTLSSPQESFTGTGAFSTGSPGVANRPNNGSASVASANFSLAGDSNARTDTETRMKNIGVRIFRRIK